MKLIGHRGDSKNFPENTISSFQAAFDRGAHSVELDIHQTRDGQLVIHHDYYLGRTSNGNGLIYNQTLDELRKLDFGAWFSPQFLGEMIPTLRELFENYHDSLHFEIELKGFGMEFVHSVGRLVDEFNLWERTEFTGSAVLLVRELKVAFNKARIGMFVPKPQAWMSVELAEKLALDALLLGNFDVAHLPSELVCASFVDFLHDAGFLAHAADCNSWEAINLATEAGCDQFSTDDVASALQCLRTHQRESTSEEVKRAVTPI